MRHWEAQRTNSKAKKNTKRQIVGGLVNHPELIRAKLQNSMTNLGGPNTGGNAWLARHEAAALHETPKEIAAANKQFHANRNYFEPVAPSPLQDEYNMARMAIWQARTHLDMLSQKTRQIDLEEEMWKQAFVVGYKRLQAAQAAGTFHDGQLQAVDRASPSQLAQESNFWPVGDFRIPSKALAERLSRRMVAKAGRVDRKIDFSSPPTDKGFGFIKSTNPSFSFALKQYYLDRKRLTGRSKCLECQDLIKKFGLPAGDDGEIKI